MLLLAAFLVALIIIDRATAVSRSAYEDSFLDLRLATPGPEPEPGPLPAPTVPPPGPGTPSAPPTIPGTPAIPVPPAPQIPMPATPGIPPSPHPGLPGSPGNPEPRGPRHRDGGSVRRVNTRRLDGCTVAGLPVLRLGPNRRRQRRARSGGEAAA